MVETEEEPPAKKVKTGWEDHTLNCEKALMKDKEGDHFATLASDSVTVIQGIGPVTTEVMEHLNVKTVSDLAKYKYFHLARAISTLAETEVEGKRPSSSVMNIDKGLDKEHENKSFKEMLALPVESLEGISADANAVLEKLNVKTIEHLANFKFCRWAEAIVMLGESYESTMTESERKQARELAKLE